MKSFILPALLAASETNPWPAAPTELVTMLSGAGIDETNLVRWKEGARVDEALGEVGVWFWLLMAKFTETERSAVYKYATGAKLSGEHPDAVQMLCD